MAGPKLPDYQTLIQAGIDPKTGLPLKVSNCMKSVLKPNIKKVLRIIDEQDAINRYKWINLPEGLNSNLIERILYYKGQAMFFYIDSNDDDEPGTFYFLPYALDGSIDVYGRFTGVTPLPFNGKSQESDKKESPWIEGLIRKPLYDIMLEEPEFADYEKYCVLLTDYSKQISQTILPRQSLNEPLLDVEADCIPFMRTSLLTGTGINGMRVSDPDMADAVTDASRSVEEAALNGEPWIPITGGTVDFQELTPGATVKPEEYMVAMQSIDNLRLSTFGLENGGLFEKKAHMLETEQATRGGTVGLIYQDGLSLRQEFCDIVNSLFGLGIWCEPSETVIGMDANLDGAGYDIQNEGQVNADMGGESDGNEDSAV